MTTPAERGRAVVLLVVCGLCWSTAGALIKLLHWHPLAIWAGRSLVCALALAALTRPSWRGLTRYELAGAIAFAATTGLFIAANKLTTAANAILIQYSAPVWVALLGAWFLGERTSRRDWGITALVLGGVALFFFDKLSFAGTLGNVIALVAGITFAFQVMLLRKVATGNPLRSVILGNALGAVIGLPWLVAQPAPDAAGWGALLALGLVQQAAAYLCYAYAIRRVTALEGLLIPILEPILSPVWVWLAWGEEPGRWALAGGAVVVGAVTVRALLILRPGINAEAQS